MLAKREAEAQPCKAEELSAPRQRVPEFFEYHIALVGIRHGVYGSAGDASTSFSDRV